MRRQGRAEVTPEHTARGNQHARGQNLSDGGVAGVRNDDAARVDALPRVQLGLDQRAARHRQVSNTEETKHMMS